MSEANSQRLGTAFSETFPLSREAIRQVLDALAEMEEVTSGSRFDFLRQNTQLGTNYVKAMPRYARGTGLLDKSSSLTQLGKKIREHDPLISRIDTQWLLHYHLSAPHGPGPAFWHHLVKERFKSGNTFTRDEVLAQVDEFIQATRGRALSRSSIKGATAAFLGTYTSPTGLGELEILEALNDGSYQVLEPEAPSTWVLAYALIDFWQAQFPNHLTLNLNNLSGSDGITSLFLVGSGRLNSTLREMQDEGYVEVHRVAPPYQVVLLRPDKQSVLERIYHHG